MKPFFCRNTLRIARKKWCPAGGKDPLFGRVDGFQIDPKGRCRTAAPLRIPRPHRRKQFGMLRIAVGWVVKNGLKDTASLRTSAHAGRLPKQKPPQRTLRRQRMYSYRYCFMPSLALAGSSEMVMVISILLSAANLAHQATKSSAAARSAPMVL